MTETTSAFESEPTEVPDGDAVPLTESALAADRPGGSDVADAAADTDTQQVLTPRAQIAPEDIAPIEQLRELAERALAEISEPGEVGRLVSVEVEMVPVAVADADADAADVAPAETTSGEGDTVELDSAAEERAIASEATSAVVVMKFAAQLAGYRDWFWTVLLTRVPESEPTVLECFMLPGDDALLAPAWVPWAERLAEFRATHDNHGNLLVPQENDGDDSAAPREHVRTMTRTRVRRRRRRDANTDASTVEGPQDEGESSSVPDDRKSEAQHRPDTDSSSSSASADADA